MFSVRESVKYCNDVPVQLIDSAHLAKAIHLLDCFDINNGVQLNRDFCKAYSLTAEGSDIDQHYILDRLYINSYIQHSCIHVLSCNSIS